MHFDFYHSKEYREKQSVITKENWRRGVFDFIYKREKRRCARKVCGKLFEVSLSDKKIYCSSGCAATINNSKRRWSDEVKLKIANALKGHRNPHKGILKIPRVEVICLNPVCGKIFIAEKYKARKFCSIQCAMDVIGGRPTSPRASRGKAGIRKDISDTIYFYSRWEANMARLYAYLGIQWVYAPTSFDLGGQMYTPDFYLPEHNTYIEVKNFWWKYSVERDQKFRKLYPYTKLDVILKPEYLALEKQYAKLIPQWEYRNSVVQTTRTAFITE